MGQNFPWFVDSCICVGIILHGLLGSQPNVSCMSFTLPGRRGGEVGLSFLYLLGGYYSFVYSMALAPYRALYALAIIGFICFASRITEGRNMVRGDISSRKSRKHSHKH
jgi:GPI inositol-deacylase